MNEQFRLLARQAMVERASGFKEFDADLFAQLIVKECVLISRTSTDGFSAGQRMEEHFGVE
jgi:hypothetical protein